MFFGKEETMEYWGTLGPGCENAGILLDMVRNGLNGMRINLSHVTLEKAQGRIRSWQESLQACGVKGRLLIDMQGAQLRIGHLDNGLYLKIGEIHRMGEGGIGVPACVIEAVEPHDRILFGDGQIQAEVTECRSDGFDIQIVNGGMLRGEKSIKIVGRQIHGPFLTETDLETLARAKDHGVTDIMIPFVHSGKQLAETREIMNTCGLTDVRLLAKIESREGVSNLEDILPHADMIVIARGDLGNDMPLYQLPSVQQKIQRICHYHQKPYMVVTQLLASMGRSPVPTRAEVNDIYHAVTEGASALMLTNETAAGRFPKEAVYYMIRTAQEALKDLQEGGSHD